MATLELEKHEKQFDEQSDEIFVRRFVPLNKVLRVVDSMDYNKDCSRRPVLHEPSDPTCQSM